VTAKDRELIAGLLDQHRTVRDQAGRVQGSLADHEALDSLEKARLDWTPGQFGSLSEKRDRLRDELGELEDGLRKHFRFEEETLPPLLGELLVRALALQHREIGREIAEARSIVAEAKLEGLEREDLLIQESRVQQRIGVVLRLVEEHAAKEELILEMIETALADAK
jgi:hypothetical protein